MRNFGQNFPIFHKLADWTGDYCPNLNHTIVFNFLCFMHCKLNFEAKIKTNFLQSFNFNKLSLTNQKLKQTFFNITVLECKGTSISNASETIDKLKDVLCHNISNLLYEHVLLDDFFSVLINYSRDANVMSILS